MWFQELAGFDETNTADVAGQFEVEGEYITSKSSGRRMRHGRFDIPNLADLRKRTRGVNLSGSLTLSEFVGDVQELHLDPRNAGAFFQVASQFNTLEMVNPSVTPEEGIGRYEHDHTQGPACAIACGAGTVFRNYLVPIGGHVGQTHDRQINCVADLLQVLGVAATNSNGYVFAESDELARVGELLSKLRQPARDIHMGHVQIGLHSDTEVTLARAGHVVTQAYCSAFPVAYSSCSADEWEPLARLVLDASYEAVFRAALLNAQVTDNNRVFLTLIGGGVFGNRTDWIFDAIQRCLDIFAFSDLDVSIVSYARPNTKLRSLLDPSSGWSDRLFRPPPQQWGLRGDPTLWLELNNALGRRAEPTSQEGLHLAIRSAFLQLTGIDPHEDIVKRLPIERYHGAGMSAGYVSPTAWRERLIPLLLERFVT